MILLYMKSSAALWTTSIRKDFSLYRAFARRHGYQMSLSWNRTLLTVSVHNISISINNIMYAVKTVYYTVFHLVTMPTCKGSVQRASPS